MIIGAVIAAAITTGVQYATGKIAAGAILATFAESFVINAAIAVVSKQLMDQPSFDSLQSGITVNERRPTSTRKVVYGTRRVGGTVVFLDTVDAEGKENRDLEMAIVLASHECESVEKIYFNDELAFTVNSLDPQTFDYVVDSPYTSDFASIEVRLGAAGQSPFSSPLVTSAKWTSDHRLDGVCSLYVRLKFDPQVFANGLPNISAEIKGKKVEDPRDSSVAFSDNAALCIRDYMINDNFGMGVDATELDDTAFSSAADVCDEAVALSAGGTESRYTINGVIDTNISPRENIAQMLTALSGKLIYSGGLFKLLPGEYRTPSITLDEDDLIAPITITTKNSQRENFNRIKGTFASPADLYQPVEYPPLESTTYQTIDGFTSTYIHDLPFTTSSATAQRLAKLQLNKTRQELTVTMPCKLTALNIAPGDFIQVNNSRLNFTNKVFEVVSTDISATDPLGINVVAQEVSQATYDWTATDEQAIINNNTPVTRQYQVNPVSNLTTSSSANVAPDGTAISSISVSWDESPHRAVFEYEVTYRFDANEPYQSIITSGNSVDLNGLVAGQQYTIRVRAITQTGAFSSYVQTTQVAAGDTTAPGTPSGLSADGVSRAIVLDWTANTEADIRHYLVYEGSSTQFSNATLIATVLTDNFTRNALPDSSTRYYWVRAVDYSGNQSGLAGPVSGTTDAAIAAEDTKAANGYVYYQISTGSQPSTPSASSYNFNTGAFSGLSSNWSIQPPSVDGTDAEYWASSWNVLEDTGGQTITFSTPFRSFQFDGLVTFTNLNNELADPNSTEITTISGGLIKTGTVDANRIELDGNTIEAGGSGIQIKNLGVDTLKIADNAVTVPDITFNLSKASASVGAQTPYVVLQKTIFPTSIGSGYAPVLIGFSLHVHVDQKEGFLVAVVRDSDFANPLYIVGRDTTGTYGAGNSVSNEILPNTVVSGVLNYEPTSASSFIVKLVLYHVNAKTLSASGRVIYAMTAKK